MNRRALLSSLGAILLVTLSTLFAYRAVLFAGADIYPWGSDTWGHLFKTLYLLRQVGQGMWYPDLLPQWYVGLEMLRYHAPLTYYLLAGLYLALGNIFLAGHFFLFAVAWFGAVTLLLFHRWIGAVPALLAASLAAWLPDHLRVAFAEGNLPRALAAAWLPLALYFLLRLLFPRDAQAEKISRGALIGLAVTLCVIVWSHAMMGAIFAAGLGTLLLLAALIGKIRATRFVAGAVGIAAGLGLSAVWLLPSLTGGITEINAGALSEALARFPPTISLNPFLRLSNPEIFYLSVALFASAFAALAQWKNLTPLARVLLLAGLLTASITFDAFYPLFAALPLHQLFWPIRFASFFGPVLLLGVCAASSAWRRAWVIVAALALACDFYPSLALAHTNPAPTALNEFANDLRAVSGWRVAVADLSRLGSAPTYLLSEISDREQVYGWAYQGARTARLVAALNESFERGMTGYALDRLNLLGVDDVLLLSNVGISAGIEPALQTTNWRAQKRWGDLTWYHRDGAPRATRIEHAILGIGSGAYDAALLFPSILVGLSPYVDDYALNELQKYPALYLSYFQWHDLTRAENILRQYVTQGGHVIIDLQGAPQDPRARAPKLLNVYGEPVILRSAVTLSDERATYALAPFDPNVGLWHAYVPQGHFDNVTTFDYRGERALALAEQTEGKGRITYIGINLVYHSLLTRDPTALQILGNVLGMTANQTPPRATIPLEAYRADARGYRFCVTPPRAGWFVIPIARLEGMRATLDGQPVATMGLDKLISIYLPEGHHCLELSMHATTIHLIGASISAFAALALLFIVLWRRARNGVTALALAFLLLTALTTSAYAAAIVIDGAFGDWSGQANITDPKGDSSDPDGDIAAVYWANNPNDPTMYWMIQRYPLPHPNGSTVTYLIHVDANNDGTYENTVTVEYKAYQDSTSVTVSHGGRGAGETRQAGAQRVEIAVPFANLGIVPRRPIRFYVQSKTGNTVRDQTQSVQITPVSVLGLPILALTTGALIVGVWWFKGRQQWTRFSS